MSNSSPPPQPSHQERDDDDTNQNDVVREASPPPNQETLNQPDPQTPNHADPTPKSDPATTLDPPEYNSPDDEADDDEEEIDEQQTPQPIADPHVSVRDVTRRGASKPKKKGKKGKGKGKSKPHPKKQQAIDEKFQSLMVKLNPIPFIPNKILDFAKHETLLKKLGLWDFVHIDFDRVIRVDLIAQLIATYESKSRASYVGGYRISVSRADMARAFRLPLRKKGNVGGGDNDSEWEALSDESVGFAFEFVSDWVLLHEDTWMMPKEVADWMKMIKEGHPEKVDWPKLFWFMVETELKKGGGLGDCYYASHLQRLMKVQREELFVKEEPLGEDVKFDEEDCEVNGGDVNVEGGDGEMKSLGEEGCLVEGPNTELTLGKDGENEEGVLLKDVDMMDVEKCKDSEEDEEEKEEEQGQGGWVFDGRNNFGEHFMQRCGAERKNDGGFGSFEIEDKKEEEEEMEEEEDDGDKFHVFPSDDALDGNGFTGDLLHGMEGNQVMAFGSQDQLCNPSSTEGNLGNSSFFNNLGKRVIGHDDDQFLHHSNESNKKLRINNSWDNKPSDFGTCMVQIQQVSERARLFYEEKEQALQQSNVNQQILLSELQKRDAVIEHLHKSRSEEIHQKDCDIYRLERELHLMGSVLEGYRKALKETQKAFAEYREKAELPEEPTYKDAGPGAGGLMLTAGELQKLHKRREEEFKMKCSIVEQVVNEFSDDLAGRFDVWVEKVNMFDQRLTGLEGEAKELIESYKKQKTTEEKMAEIFEPLPVQENEEEMPENAESLLMSQTGGKVSEVEENEEEMLENTENLSMPQTEVKVSEVEEDEPNE